MIYAIDFETHLIGDGNMFPAPICLSTYSLAEGPKLYRGKEIALILEKILKKDVIIAHNAAFECGVIVRKYPYFSDKIYTALDEGRIICTKINEQLLNIVREKPNYQFSLADLVLKYFDQDISASKTADSWRLRYHELEFVDEWPQEAIDYSLEDSIWAFRINQKQGKLTHAVESVRAAVTLNLMASTGMTIDLTRATQLKKEIWVQLQPVYDFLLEKGMCVRAKKTNKILKCTKLFRNYVDTLGIEIRKTLKGETSIDGESLCSYKNQIKDDIIEGFAAIGIYEKILTSYLNRMTKNTIYTQYDVVKTTGRTSSSGSKLYTSLNIQQMPRKVPDVTYDVRNCFVPRAGYNILSIDYAGLELCSTAHQLYKLYGRSKMRELLNGGEKPVDMHSMLAATLKKVTYEEFLANKNNAAFKDVRQLAKPINLGFPGGIGYDTMRTLLWQAGIQTRFVKLHKSELEGEIRRLFFTLRKEYESLRIARIDEGTWALVDDELVELKRKFFSLYPELEKFLKEGHKRFLTGNVKYVKDEYGKWKEEPMYQYNIYGFKRDWCQYTAFCNGYLMQTPAAIGAKRAVYAIMKEWSKQTDVRPLAFIHDEILFELKEGREDLVPQLAETMMTEMQSILTSVRITVEASLMKQWQKADGFWTEKYWKNVKG